MVKADTIDVNIAGSERMTPAAWAAAAAEFGQQLAGVPLLSQQQVRRAPAAPRWQTAGGWPRACH